MVLIAVTVMWCLAVVADIALANYDIPPYVHAAMLAVVGYLFRDWKKEAK